jgi:hypothetical protein
VVPDIIHLDLYGVDAGEIGVECVGVVETVIATSGEFV